MRLPEYSIKAAILHHEEEVRLTALRHFTRSSRPDESIMPLVIESVQRQEMTAAFRMLRDAERLPQTDATMDWLIGELHRELDISIIADDNYRFAVALVLCNASPQLITQYYDRIAKAPLFPKQLRPQLEATVNMSSWGWDRMWSEFVGFTRRIMQEESLSRRDASHMHRLVKMLALHEESSELVMALLQRRNHGIDEELANWIEPWTVELAGHMKLESAIPYLIERSHLAENDVADECGVALGRIGTDKVAEAIASDWECGDFDFRMTMTEAMSYIHSDKCAGKPLAFLYDEKDFEIQLELGTVLLSHFLFKGIEPVRQLVLGDEDELDNEQFGLRYHLVAAARIMDVNFPEHKEWHRKAVSTDYGWGEREETRIAENVQA